MLAGLWLNNGWMEKITEDYPEADYLSLSVCFSLPYYCWCGPNLSSYLRETHTQQRCFQSQPKRFPGIPDILSLCVKNPSVATGTPKAKGKNAATLKGRLLTYAGSRSQGDPVTQALLLTYSSGAHRGVLHQKAVVMTGDGFLLRLPRAERPSFVGHNKVLFKKGCRASTRSFTDEWRTRFCRWQHRAQAAPADTDARQFSSSNNGMKTGTLLVYFRSCT